MCGREGACPWCDATTMCNPRRHQRTLLLRKGKVVIVVVTSDKTADTIAIVVRDAVNVTIVST